MRMRTIPEIAKIVKNDDPETSITAYTLRKMVKSGMIPITQVGNRQYIDLDKLEDYMSGERVEQSKKPAFFAGI